VPDPYRKLQYGQVIDFRTVTWNAMIEAALAQKARQHDRRVPERPSFRQADIIRVKNESDHDLSRGHVLGLEEPIFTPTDSEDAFLREVTFGAGVPDVDDHRGRFCVALDPIGAGRIGRAYVAGVCPVRILVTDEEHAFADVDDGRTDRLISGEGGGAQILWRDGQDGEVYGYDDAYEDTEQWAIVRLGPDVTGGGFVGITTGGAIGAATAPAWTSGSATLYSTGGTSATSLGVRTVYHWLNKAIPSGTAIVGVYVGRKPFITGANC
jgi:hypothetical protein